MTTALILLSEWEKSQIEFWKPVNGFPGYDISSKGRVRSRYVRAKKRGHHGHVRVIGDSFSFLSFGKHYQGYRVAYLYRKGKKRFQAMVHRLVAEAFIPNPDGLPEVNHLTGLKRDARVDALEWSTRLDNQRHAWKNGLITGQHIWRTRPSASRDFTVEDVLDIRQRRASGESGEALRKEYGVSNACISAIATGKLFPELGGPRTRRKDEWKLLPETVREIRKLAMVVTQREIAQRFNVEPSEVSRIVARKRYAYVTD